jgi:thiol:disulfide interchange protein/DsbC/DsbD-like thiol-disulfide interchange protein
MFRWLLLPLLLVAAVHAQEYEGKTLVRPSLIADTAAVVPGKPFQVGLLLEMAPGWHTYWEYPGDAGFPTTITWKLPEGFAAGPIQWPLPHREIEPGDIEVYAYKDRVLLLTTIVAPADLQDATVTLKARADWLVCAEICIPGSADLELALPVADQAAPAHEEIFATFRAELPLATTPPFELTWKQEEKETVLTVSGLGDATSVDVFPLPAQGQEIGHPKGGSVTGGTATVTIPATGPIRGVLVVDTPQGRRGWLVSLADSEPVPRETARPAVPPDPTPAEFPLWKALLFGFLGGLILNLMPCVLPVISLKIFGFIRQAGDRPERILRHGLAFVAGIFAFFLGLGLVIAALKAGGREVTWAFQFQNPWFNVVIGSLVFAFALNLFGVFEIVLPGKAAQALDEASSGEGYLGSFSQGVFATLLATPCTAPFLGSALGFAFSQPPSIILLTFASVALGMGAPYFVLSARPGWMKILPKPGVWMERLKQFMGFPLIATLLWLLYILGNQKGLEGVLWFGCFLLCVALACWIYGAFCGPLSKPATRTVSLLLIVLLLAGGGWYFLGDKFRGSTRPDTQTVTAGGIPWQPFSRKTLDDLRAEGEPVFVDFTADWCLTCKVNERTALDVPSVREAMQKQGIVPLKADWTNANPEITAALKSFGRVGVPFYVLYPANHGEPIVLPELLTQQIVLDALARAR